MRGRRRPLRCRRVNGDRLGPGEWQGDGAPTGQAARFPLDAHADVILALIGAGTKDISLAEIAERLEAERGVRVGSPASGRSSTGTYKKDRARRRAGARGVLRAWQAWFDGQLDLDPDKLIFIGETGASTKWRACGVASAAARAAGPPGRTATGRPRPSRPGFAVPA